VGDGGRTDAARPGVPRDLSGRDGVADVLGRLSPDGS
jgi:hypothetical protein